MASARNETVTWRSLRWVVAVVAVLAAVGLFVGNNFAHSYVSDQLAQEKIDMPTAESTGDLPKESQDALKPYFGQQMTTGPQAEAYANHYILVHMRHACDDVTTADGTAVAPVPEDQCTYAGIGGVVRGTEDPDAKAAYNALRDSNFKGDALRGMLLNTYGWWLVGSIAFWAAVGALVVAAAMVVLNFVPRRKV